MAAPASTKKNQRAARKSRRGKQKEKAAPGPSPSGAPQGALGRLLWPATRRGRYTMLGILVVALALRIHNLLSMFPILVDESIYLRWAEIIDHQGQWFISLLDGKEPFTYWILALVRKTFGGDPLLEGRLVSVAAGLLSTVGIFAIGRHLAGETAGLVSAGLYACFPYALLYDRLAYTEAFVNLFGIAIVLTSLICFENTGSSWKRGLAPGLALGLGLFTKQTVLLFAFFPALVGLWKSRGQKRSVLIRLALTYMIAAFFVGFSLWAVPEAPMLDTHDPVLHHTGFFVQPSEFLSDPLKVAPSNLARLGGYISSYLTMPAALGALAALLYLTWNRSAAAWVVLSVSVLPLLVQVFVLELMFPSRYPFPHFWPWLVVAGMGSVKLWERYRTKLTSQNQRLAAATLVAAVFAGPMLYRSVSMLGSPREHLHPEDSKNFLGSSAHAGFGIREAVDFLIAQAAQGPFVLLTDPIWGPPADAMFPYLNRRYAIRVYEAWWMQLSGDYLILPQGKAEMIKSHYERTKSGMIDFSQLPRVFYVTDTNYYTPGAVHVRQPDARLIASFPKPNQKDSIDVYRLK